MAWITDGEKIEKRIALNPAADMNHLADIIVKRGGNIWTKKGNRAYFPDEIETLRPKEISAPIWKVYLDLETKEIVFNMSDQDEHLYDEVVYKKTLIDFLRK
jgi:hypothetical protein